MEKGASTSRLQEKNLRGGDTSNGRHEIKYKVEYFSFTYMFAFIVKNYNDFRFFLSFYHCFFYFFSFIFTIFNKQKSFWKNNFKFFILYKTDSRHLGTRVAYLIHNSFLETLFNQRSGYILNFCLKLIYFLCCFSKSVSKNCESFLIAQINI